MKRSLLKFLIFFSAFTSLSAFPEMSGLTYASSTDMFYAVGDEGHIFELDRDMKILRSVYLGAFDFEAVTFIDELNRLYCLDESELLLLEVDLSDLSIKSIEPLNNRGKLKDKFIQFESLVYKEGFLFLGVTYKSEKKGEGALLRFTPADPTAEKIFDIPVRDISGLAYRDPCFVIISDKEDKLILFSEEEEILESRDINGDHQEGVSILGDDIYIVDESGRYRIISNLFKTEQE